MSTPVEFFPPSIMEAVIQPFNAEMWYMIREKLDSGMSVSDIAKEMGISRSTVRKYLM
jgi:predicted transcriptional regulator